MDDKLTFQSHINQTINQYSQAFFALRTLRHQGLSDATVHQIFASKVLSQITCASPAWWGFVTEAAKDQLEAFLRKARKFNFYPTDQPNFTNLVEKLESSLFQNTTTNINDCLHPLLPPLKRLIHNLRRRGHGCSLPAKDDRNFVNRMYKLV